MDTITEKFFKAFDAFLEENGGADSEEEYRKKLKVFMKQYNNEIAQRVPLTEKNAKSADDYMELAETAESPEEVIRLAGKALRLEPDNLDAEVMVAALSAKDNIDRVRKIEKVVAHGNEIMQKEGYFDEECIGEFWLIHQTRPYMRVRQAYADTLIDAGMFEAAAEECEDMLRLCDNDNLGARYTLMHLYAMQGSEEKALRLLEKYDEDGAMMLMPLAVLYYKRNNLDEASKYLRRILKNNPDLKKFLKRAAKHKDLLPDDFNPSMFRPYSFEELLITFFENNWLYITIEMFFIWADEEIDKKSRGSSSKKKPYKH